MSKTSIPIDIRRDLWFEAHGRCEICNKPLYRDGVTMKEVNLSEYAHIIADSPKGPRGDEELSEKLCDKKENLILLCKDHHKLIDDAGGVDMFGVDLLREYKRNHEERIELVTDIKPNNKTLVVCYAPKIGHRQPPLTDKITYDTIFPDYYPLTVEPLRLHPLNVPFSDGNTKYWEIHPDILLQNFKDKLANKISDITHITLFAIAPQPLLTLLGTLLGDLYPVEVMQKHRDPNTWKWPKSDTNIDNHFRLIEPEDKRKEPAIIFAISGSDIIQRVKNQFDDTFGYWILTCDAPDRDMLKTQSQLAEFRNLVRRLINDINTSALGKSIRIFPAMPVSCAVELGRIRLPKSDNPWVMYDLPQEYTEYVETITIQ